MGKQVAKKAPSTKAEENLSSTPLFRSIVKAYDDKNYKKGIKLANEMLSLHPNHAETLSMKGLITSMSGKNQQVEAMNYARAGLKSNLRSSTCWHVYGLLFRTEPNYEEAIKCFKQALKIEEENMTILKDLATLQVQTRDLTGYLQTGTKILNLKSNLRHNWIVVAVANYLLGRFSECLKILRLYKDTLEEVPVNDYEIGEMFMFENEVMEKCPEEEPLEKILEHLNAHASFMLDKICVKERRASLLFRLERLDEAEKMYLDLIRCNCECHAYFIALEQLNQAKHQKAMTTFNVLAMYQDLQKKFPDSMAAKRLALDRASGADFVKELQPYLQKFLRKGIPSAFSDIKSLYASLDKAIIIDEELSSFEGGLRKDSKFPKSESTEDKSVLVWTLHAKALSLDKTKKHSAALKLIEEAISLSPDILELYIAKARILKHMGRLTDAALTMQHAQKNDVSDRWYNSKATLYLLRTNQHAQAKQLIEKFALQREEKVTKNNLVEMQCVWWAHESARCFFRQGQLGRALKHVHHIHKFFGEFVDDQFEFHAYCARKMTLRAYVDLVSFEDSIYSHPFFVVPAILASQIYLATVDAPPAASTQEVTQQDDAADKDKKKSQKNKNKDNKATKDKGQAKEPEPEEDPDGTKLLTAEDPLKVASNMFVSKLNDFAADWIMTHVVSFQIYAHRSKFLLVLRAVKRGWKLLESTRDSGNAFKSHVEAKKCPPSGRAEMITCIAQFAAKYQSCREGLPIHVTQIIDRELDENFSSEKINKFVKAELQAFPNSITHQVADFQIAHLSNPASVPASVDSWVSAVTTKKALAKSTVGDAKKSMQALQALSGVNAEPFCKLCETVWEGANFDLM